MLKVIVEEQVQVSRIVQLQHRVLETETEVQC